MIRSISCTALSVALEQLKKIVAKNEAEGKRTVVFCEDRLSLAAERTVCSAVEGTFTTYVYTFARFLAAECGKPSGVLSAQGSAMAVRAIIEENRNSLIAFKQLSAPSAAQAVYDTIALLYSSRISAEDVAAAAEGESGGGLLGSKLKDLSLIYTKYVEYLKDNGLEDRNGYLKRLAPVIEASPQIKGACVIFLGFQAFTCTTTECARAAFTVAAEVTGLFIGGREDIYVNESRAAFLGAAAEFGGSSDEFVTGEFLPEAEELRKSLFNPESRNREKLKTTRVHVFEACDTEEELEFIAANIKRHVLDLGERYSKISVMLPDLANCESAVARVFSRYRIPYFADRRIALAEHPLSAFIFSYLNCVVSGCRPQDVDGVVSSPFFPAERRDKDIFRNYSLRLANYRGGVRREPKKEILDNFAFDICAVERVRQTFLNGYKILTQNGVNRGIFGGLRNILEEFAVEDKLLSLAETYAREYPAKSAFSARALNGVLSVLAEAEELSAGMNLKEIIKVLKSGFTAAEISLIPPKADAVFVGDIASTANTGSNVVFAARLTGEVPGVSADTSLLTDREITSLERAKLNISPKIRQVNLRKREVVALNICAFKEHLYLSYPTRLGAEVSNPSEIITCATGMFLTKLGKNLVASNFKQTEPAMLLYYASEKLPALKQLVRLKNRPEELSAIYSVLARHGFKKEADEALKTRVHPNISCGKQLYSPYGSISPTALESYFLCPFLGFMRQGLKVQEREEGAVRALDTGNFIHAVLEDLAREVNGITDDNYLTERARAIATEKLAKPPYSALADIKSGQYTAAELVEEAVKVSAGMYEQLKNSRFEVSGAEGKCEIPLTADLKLYGRIDRVDEYGDMVRIIDYKTGTVDSSAPKYYTGLKLQLPLYLLSVAEGKRAVGAYYFPAAVEYRANIDGVFRLKGYMDGSAEVVSASDITLQLKQKSAYFDAYLGGLKIDSAMPTEVFAPFLSYSGLVARRGAGEMLSGNITPSPAESACEYCKMGGSCGFAAGLDGGERKLPSINCAEIAEIAKNANGGGNGGTD